MNQGSCLCGGITYQIQDEIGPIIENHSRGREIINPSNDYVDTNKLFTVVEADLKPILKDNQEVKSTIQKLNENLDLENFYPVKHLKIVILHVKCRRDC